MNYARALFPYRTGVQGDLELQVGDVIEVLAEVDKNWLRAQSFGKIGLVPRQFVERLSSLDLTNSQSLYIAHTDYQSSHPGDLQFHRGDLLIVHEHLANGWLRGSLHFDLPGTTFRPTGIFPNTFVNLLKSKSNNESLISFERSSTSQSSHHQIDLLLPDLVPIQFVRVISDIQPTNTNELRCSEDDILAVINGDVNSSEWLEVKNQFNSMGRVKRMFVEPFDDRHIDDESSGFLFVPDVQSKTKTKKSSPTNSNRDSIQELVSQEFSKMMMGPSSKTPIAQLVKQDGE